MQDSVKQDCIYKNMSFISLATETKSVHIFWERENVCVNVCERKRERADDQFQRGRKNLLEASTIFLPSL